MLIQENASLFPYNTFGIRCSAEYLAQFTSVSELQEILSQNKFHTQSKLLLGGGSNILFTKDFNGLVLLNEIKGIETVAEDPQSITLKVGGGENWHQFVSHCVSKGWGGLENLSLIPGKVGAAPMQNIGAYGVEQNACFIELDALDMISKSVVIFSKSDCHFGYRESYFKQKGKDRYAITSVTYKLNKHPKLNIEYGAIGQELDMMGVSTPTIGTVAQAVINIRSSKLPDPKDIGNSGSFFKNPIIENVIFELLKSNYPTIVAYPAQSGYTKLAAGWLIEKAGWKGYREGDFGVHKNQALVLVNYGNASGAEIIDLSNRIIDDVKLKFGVDLEREVNIV